MMRTNNKTCIVCGEVYTYCPNCAQFAHLPKWKNIFHNENCKKLFETVSDFKQNEITIDEAKEKIKDVDLSYIDKVKKSISEGVDIIMKHNSKENDEHENNEDVTGETIKSTDSAENTKTKRTRKK